MLFLHVEYWALLWYSHIIHSTRKLARLHLIGARPVLDEMIGVFAPRDFYPSKTNSWPFASFTTCITTILNLNIHRLSFCRTICLNLESTIVVGNFLMTWELDAASVEAALGRWRKIRCRCLQDSFEESCIWNWCKRCKWSDPVSLLFVRSKNAHGWSFLYLFARYPKWILFETNGMNDENFGPGTERQLSCTDVIRKFDSPMDHEFRNIIKYNHSVIYCIILSSKYIMYISNYHQVSWNTMRSRFDTFSHQKLLDWWLLVTSSAHKVDRPSACRRGLWAFLWRRIPRQCLGATCNAGCRIDW